MEIDVYKQDGTTTGDTAELPDAVFDIEPRDHAIWLDVRSIQAGSHQGTHKTKERSEVRGGGRKPWRQKGTGRARHGSIRSPHWKGGGTVFGPKPKNYKVKLTKKTKRLARASALTYKAREDGIVIVKDFELETPRTQEIAGLLRLLELDGDDVLIITEENDQVVYKSARNIPNVQTREAASVSTYDLLNADVLVIEQSALDPLLRPLLRAVPQQA